MTLRQKVYPVEGDASLRLVYLLTLEADNLTLRATNWSEDIVHDGLNFRAQSFEATMATAGDDAPPTAGIRIDNVNLMFMTAIRSVSDTLTATLEMVSPTTPNHTEIGPYEFNCQVGKYDGSSVELGLTYEDVLNMAVPHHVCSPGIMPGLFR